MGRVVLSTLILMNLIFCNENWEIVYLKMFNAVLTLIQASLKINTKQMGKLIIIYLQNFMEQHFLLLVDYVDSNYLIATEKITDFD